MNKETIYAITQKINDRLHSDFGMKDLYHRMIFTACALVARRYGAEFSPDMVIQDLTNMVTDTLAKFQDVDGEGMGLLIEVYSEIRMNLKEDAEDESERKRVAKLVGEFVDCVSQISDCIDSDEWNGEDVMGIFFNEFSRYKKKSDSGQVFTPEHITGFIYRLLGCGPDDKILDGTCGSGAFLTKSMANMIRDAGGVDSEKAESIKRDQLFGIEYDREVFALACANMLIHKGGRTNLAQMDARTEMAAEWIRSKPITKVLMNPPYENKYGCLEIVKNVLDNVTAGTKCAFILPDKKLEKGSKKLIKEIISNNRITHIIKMPKDLFFGVGVETSVFVIEAGTPQNGQKIFTYYIEDDGLVVVKNKGRHDVKNKWPAIEAKALEGIANFRGGEWINPEEHLSYQVPEKPFEICEEDFERTALQYMLFKKGVGQKKTADIKNDIANAVLYNSKISETADKILIEITK